MSQRCKKAWLRNLLDTGEDRDAVGMAACTCSGQQIYQCTSPSLNTPSLDQFTIDLTERARAGKIDAVLGRESEIRQVIDDSHSPRRQNNPILTGEAGVW